MTANTAKKPGSATRFTNSIDYWRRKRGFTWKALADAVGTTYPPLMRAAETLTERHSAGGGFGREKTAKLAEVLGVKVWQLYVPAEDAEKIFG